MELKVLFQFKGKLVPRPGFEPIILDGIESTESVVKLLKKIYSIILDGIERTISNFSPINSAFIVDNP